MFYDLYGCVVGVDVVEHAVGGELVDGGYRGGLYRGGSCVGDCYVGVDLDVVCGLGY